MSCLQKILSAFEPVDNSHINCDHTSPGEIGISIDLPPNPTYVLSFWVDKYIISLNCPVGYISFHCLSSWSHNCGMKRNTHPNILYRHCVYRRSLVNLVKGTTDDHDRQRIKRTVDGYTDNDDRRVTVLCLSLTLPTFA